MAAHLRPLAGCKKFGCERPATVELRNTWNAVIGVYCAPHGNAALKAFEKEHPDQAASR